MTIHMYAVQTPCRRRGSGQSLDLFAAVRRRRVDGHSGHATGPRGRGGWSPAAVGAREISGFKAWQSGHWYFALRTAAQIRCVMFRRTTVACRAPQMGCRCSSSRGPPFGKRRGVPAHRGRLLSTERGAVAARFEKAKAALAKDGLLDPARKRPLPPYPLRIAVVTSPDGAALQDIIAVTARAGRSPSCRAADRVQGDGAEQEICAALALLCRVEDWDLAIIGRGGGSREDLWTSTTSAWRGRWPRFRCRDSAVGHETDVTLCDLVADVRAATPSAAAEAATPTGRCPGRARATGRAVWLAASPGAQGVWPSASTARSSADRHAGAATRAPPSRALGAAGRSMLVTLRSSSAATRWRATNRAVLEARREFPAGLRFPPARHTVTSRASRRAVMARARDPLTFAQQLERLERSFAGLEAQDSTFDEA